MNNGNNNDNNFLFDHHNKNGTQFVSTILSFKIL